MDKYIKKKKKATYELHWTWTISWLQKKRKQANWMHNEGQETIEVHFNPSQKDD